ncbi:MAG: fumarate hydratase [Arenicellales bacterium]|jgi:fumarate hydratase class I|nr:fumarate hydratase [Arenicellales bacterium]
MTTICQDDLIQSVTDALQYISYNHSPDFIKAMARAYEEEQSPAAKDAIRQILINSRLAAEGRRPICQDTGIVVVFAKIGMEVNWEGDLGFDEMVNEGVRKAYSCPDNILRKSVVSPPVGDRKNTGDNTPAVIHSSLVPGKSVEITLAAKGGGSENKSKFTNLNPNESVADWIVEQIPSMGAGWCPPGILGVGIGGTAEKAMLLAKEALMEPIDIHQLQTKGAVTALDKLRLELYNRINNLGIGAQGVGGLTTVLDVKINQYPTHAASLPVAIIPNCAATRHLHFVLDGSGPANLPLPSFEDWPRIDHQGKSTHRQINLDEITREAIKEWKVGETLLLSGKILTGRDAAHKKIAGLFEQEEPLPPGVDFRGRFIYYVGPVDPVRDEVVGPAGPTTATRMDKYTEMMLSKTALLGMIGKAERGPVAIESIKRHGAVYLSAVGGAAYLVSKAIRKARVVAFEELGMEAIYEFEVQDMPVTVAVDTTGQSLHRSGPEKWRKRISQP